MWVFIKYYVFFFRGPLAAIGSAHVPVKRSSGIKRILFDNKLPNIILNKTLKIH